MGISYDEFWTLNPRKLNVIVEGYKLKRQIEDEKQWMLGGYTYAAVSVALSNAFKKKGQKSKDYFEVIEKPYLKDHKQIQDNTDKEKQRKIELVMAGLRTKQANFELKHRK